MVAWTHDAGSPLAPFADGFREQLVRLGYTANSVVTHIVVMGQLSRWLSAAGLEAGELTWARVEEFFDARRDCGQRRMPTLVPLMDYLGAQDVLGPPTSLVPTPLVELLDLYRCHLVHDRGLAPSTVLCRERTAGRFLSDRSSAAGGGTGAEGLTGADVQAFLLGECSVLTVGSAKNRVTEIRSLLRFLRLHGVIEADLAAAVPPVAGWRDTALPATMSIASVQALLDSCDRSQPTGMRDFAILILLARLGLRSCEVAGLGMDDVDWRAGEISIRGTGGGLDRLPLPADVGEAVVAYLSAGRPITECRLLFLTCLAPLRGIRPGSIGHVVHRACERSGLPPVSPHRLRHALATEMLAQGVTLMAISQVLRHRDLATTAVYAKVDRISLRTVAQEWPGAGR